MKIGTIRVSILFVLAAFALFCCATPQARADYLWSWHYSCSFETYSKCSGGSGQYTSTTNAQGSSQYPYYELTGITGIVEGYTIASLLPSADVSGPANRISADVGYADYGQPYSTFNAGKIVPIFFVPDGYDVTYANSIQLYQNFDSSIGDQTQLLFPGGNFIPDVDFSVKFEGIVDPIGAPVPEPSSLSLITLGCCGLGFIATLRRDHRSAEAA